MYVDAIMNSRVVLEFKHMGTCMFPVVFLGAQFQVLVLGGSDCVFKCFAQFVCFSSGLDSCIFGFGL